MRRFISPILLAGALAALGAAACGGEESVSPPPAPPAPAAQPDSAAPEPAPGPPPGDAETIREPVTLQVWFRRGEKLFATRRTVEKTPRVAAAALEALLAGPSEAEAAAGIETEIPAGTRLEAVSVENGVATVDLGSDYPSGEDTRSVRMRLAQVVYTLTQLPTVQGVQLSTGDDWTLYPALGRADYEELLPAIVAESPSIGERVGNPAHIAGQANVFEANVNVRILDAAGTEIARTFITATCGTGCLGDFAADVDYEVDAEQPGTIQLHSDDAADTGTLPDLVEIPVILTPPEEPA